MCIQDIVKRVYRRFFINSNHRLLCKLLREANTFRDADRQIHKKEGRILQQNISLTAGIAKELQIARQKQAQDLSWLKRYLQDQFSFVRQSLEVKQQNQVKVSVLIPVYNTEEYLPHCLESVLRQDLDSFEVVCIDDGSTDSSLKILREYANRDQRVRVFSIQNQGPGHARNLALKKAKGEFISFLDSDDYLEEGALDFLYNEASSLDLDVLYFDSRQFYDPPELKKSLPYTLNDPRYTRPKEYSDIVEGQAFFVKTWQEMTYNAFACLQLPRRSLIDRYNLTFPEGILYEDEVFTLSCMLYASRVAHRRKTFHVRRLRPNSIMTGHLTEKNIYSYLKSWLEFASKIADIPMTEEANKCATAYLQMMYSRNSAALNKFNKAISPDSPFFSSFSYYVFAKIFPFPLTHKNIATKSSFIISGFSNAEEDFTWTDGNEARIVFCLPPKLEGKDLICRFKHFTYAERQHVTVKANETTVLDYESRGLQQKEFLIPTSIIKNRVLVLTFLLPDAVSPQSRKESEDARKLAIAMQSLSICEAPAKVEGTDMPILPALSSSDNQHCMFLSFTKGGEIF